MGVVVDIPSSVDMEALITSDGASIGDQWKAMELFNRYL